MTSTSIPDDVASPAPPSAAERLEAGLGELASDQVQRIADAMDEIGREYEMWMDEEETELISTSLQPFLLDPATRGYLHHATWQIRRALQQLQRWVGTHEAITELIPRSDDELQWFEQFSTPGAADHGMFCRVDALLQQGDPGRPSELQFIEPNIVGLGGLSYTDDTASALLEHVVAPIMGDSHEHLLTKSDDPRVLLCGELRDFAHRLGIDGSPVAALVDEREALERDGEERRLVEWFLESQMDIVYADPCDLSVSRDGEIIADGRAIDVIFRQIELKDLLELDRDDDDFDGFKAAFERGIVMPPITGDLDHKTVFEILTRRDLPPLFSETQQKIFERHVLWTRLLSDRRTHTPRGENVDLSAYVRDHRRELVIKPNRSYGGYGVLLGAATDPDVWDDAIEDAVSHPGRLVVQRAAPLVRRSIALAKGDQLHMDSAYSVLGAFPSPHGMGVIGRFSNDNVVNITRGGGVVPTLIDYS